MDCPCGSGAAFAACCEPILADPGHAPTAEALMRARYTAYTRVEMDFLTDTIHPERRDDNDPDSVKDWAENSEWLGLEIVDTVDGGPDDDTGKVEFVAVFTYEEETQRYHEVADFDRIDGRWYFREGRPPVAQPVVRSEPRIGRNDPCPCGSGRKYKRCCGA